jgi:hypothetical protein
MPVNHDTRAGRRRQRRMLTRSWTPLPTDMLESPAWRVLPLSSLRIISRICIELRRHGGRAERGVPVTFDDFEEYGIHRHAIASAIRVAVALGFIEIVEQGRAGNAEFRRATRYRPTFSPMVDWSPTFAYRRTDTIEEAERIKKDAMRSRRRRQNQIPVAENTLCVGGENRTLPSTETAPTRVGAENYTTIDSFGVGASRQAQPGRAFGNQVHHNAEDRPRPRRTMRDVENRPRPYRNIEAERSLSGVDARPRPIRRHEER